MLYHTRNFIQCFACWNWPLSYRQSWILFLILVHFIIYQRFVLNTIQKYSRLIIYNIHLILNLLSTFKSKAPIFFEVGLHSWHKSLFQDRSDFRRDLRFPFHYFIFIYFRCLISNIYLLSVYNESSQGSLVSISCYFLYLL